MDQLCVIIVMGVSGSGKSTIGAALAAELDWHFHDADEDHPTENIQRMRGGKPLTDEHRAPWLNVLSGRIEHWIESHQPTVLACSALTRQARRALHNDDPRVRLVYLCSTRDVVRERMCNREHFMPPSLLDSQFDLLEEPGSDENAITIDAADLPNTIIMRIRDQLKQ